jgi:alpha-beta hydrolase superfamily lysophospholipase
VYDNIESYGGDTRRVFVSGHSAGAHLAALVALDKRFLADVAVPPSFIKGVVSISGIYTVAAPLPGGINSWTNWGFRYVCWCIDWFASRQLLTVTRQESVRAHNIWNK